MKLMDTTSRTFASLDRLDQNDTLPSWNARISPACHRDAHAVIGSDAEADKKVFRQFRTIRNIPAHLLGDQQRKPVAAFDLRRLRLEHDPASLLLPFDRR